MRTIAVDFDVHQKIEAERRSFEEEDNTVVRRLIGLEPDLIRTALSAEKVEPSINTTRTRPWRGEHGVVLPHGTDVYMTYGRGSQEFHGKIEDGWWVVNGQRYKTPSGAASGCATKPDGTHPVLGGYKYWYVKVPGEKEWTFLDTFRLKKQSTTILP